MKRIRRDWNREYEIYRYMVCSIAPMKFATETVCQKNGRKFSYETGIRNIKRIVCLIQNGELTEGRREKKHTTHRDDGKNAKVRNRERDNRNPSSHRQ